MFKEDITELIQYKDLLYNLVVRVILPYATSVRY